MKFLNIFSIQSALAANQKIIVNSGDTTLAGFAKRVSITALMIIGAAALGFIIYSGVLFITSSGDPERVKRARQTLTWVIAGVIVIALSYAVIVYLNQTLTGFIKK